jgi:hypothetical protein
MTGNSSISMRWRAVAPLAAVGLAFNRRLSLTAQELPQYLRNDQFSSMLSLVPASVAGPSGSLEIATFADIAAQLAAGGIEPPDSIEDDERLTQWMHATFGLAIADPIRSNALTLTRDLLGYDVTDLDQTLYAGLPPDVVTLFRGRFHEESVALAWELNGYRMLEVDEIPVASLAEDADFDLTGEIQRFALSRMNNAAFLPDGTLAYTATLPMMEQVIATANGNAESLRDREDVAAVLATLDEPVVSAVLFSGEAIALDEMLYPALVENEAAMTALETTLAETGEMPPIALGLVGVTAGGPTIIYDEGEEPLIELPPATIVYRLLMAEPGTADTAAKVADARLSTMDSLVTQQPYAEIFGEWDARSIAGDSILAIDLTTADRPISIWPQMLFARDLLFLAW